MTTIVGDPAQVADALLRDTAAKIGVCVRPVIRRVTDTHTGEVETVPLPCGSTRERVCPSCAAKAKRLRMQQCRDGWHRTDDPADLDDHTGDDSPDDADQPGEGEPKPVPPAPRRSTRRLSQFPPLPVAPIVEPRTVGRELTSPTGRVYRPSTFLTLTLPSYGKVYSVKDVRPNHPEDWGLVGTPKDPDSYDYRRAALDAIHFPKLVDRFWQNLRRCAGYKVQYFAAVEPQRRLALHMHAAARGAIGRGLVRAVAAATYEQVWWPQHDEPVYVDRLPVWDEHDQAYVDPDTRAALTTWDQAIDRTYEPDADPAHLLWLGEQVDSQWFIPGSPRTDRRIGYICKYLTKSVAEAYDPDHMSPSQREHLRHLHTEVRWLPCCPECPNWLRFGIQPKDPAPGLEPGYCPRPAHALENLGHGGRRVLVSRDWSGMTLGEHKAERAEVVRIALTEAGLEPPESDRWSADQTSDDGTPRYVWEPTDISADGDVDTYRLVLRRTIAERLRWQHEYDTAKERARPPDGRSATGRRGDWEGGARDE